MGERILRTTLALPSDLVAAVDEAVQAGKARSRNELVSTAIRRELRAIERAAVDDAFAGMAEDVEYHAEARQIMREFAAIDHEVLDTCHRLSAEDDRATG
jgi:metal-responsive CopG/Arc/MetJ family transcriptional regulator